MRDLTSEELDEIIDKMAKDLEIIKMSRDLSYIMVHAMNTRRPYKCMFYRFSKRIPVAGTQQAVILYADMGAN